MSSQVRRGSIPGVKVFNASDVEQSVQFNSVVYTLPPNKVTELHGQLELERDEFGRPTEEAIIHNRMIPNPHATSDAIARHIEVKYRDRGLCLLNGDETDAREMTEVRNAWIRKATMDNRAIEARWRQRCIDSKNSGAGIPPMPQFVADAQDFLIKYRNGIVEQHKRFVVTMDGRSFDTKLEARNHIKSRYPSESAEWESLINDTRGDVEADPAESIAAVALKELAEKSASKKNKETE